MTKPKPKSATPDAGETVILDYGGKPRMVSAGSRYWSKTSEAVFLTTLAQTCNVKAAAEAAGFNPFTPYRHRRNSPAFAARWQEALAMGYERLEEALLNAAIASLSGDQPVPDAPLPPMTVAEAMNLLRLHRDEVKGGTSGKGMPRKPMTPDEAQAKIARKLAAIERARDRA